MVVGTARKPLLVALAVVFFGKQISTTTGVGIILPFAGVAWYNKVKFDETAAKKAEELSRSRNKELESPDSDED